MRLSWKRDKLEMIIDVGAEEVWLLCSTVSCQVASGEGFFFFFFMTFKRAFRVLYQSKRRTSEEKASCHRGPF